MNQIKGKETIQGMREHRVLPWVEVHQHPNQVQWIYMREPRVIKEPEDRGDITLQCGPFQSS